MTKKTQPTAQDSQAESLYRRASRDQLIAWAIEDARASDNGAPLNGASEARLASARLARHDRALDSLARALIARGPAEAMTPGKESDRA